MSVTPSSTSTRLAQIIYSILALGFVGLVVWASLTADFGTSFSAIAADPWGVVSLADLYFGFALFAVFIVLVDGLEGRTLAWILALMLLGNAIAALWLIRRLPDLVRRFR